MEMDLVKVPQKKMDNKKWKLFFQNKTQYLIH